VNKYPTSTDFIDWENPTILQKAHALAKKQLSIEAVAQNCFEFVRDEIKHSNDFALNPVTCKASDVLKHATGYCYAKSHLLAALLRANGIPTGLFYQRLSIDNDQPPFCFHSLNAVYLEKHGWCRIEARGNKDGISAEFCPPVEKLAFPIVTPGEADLPEIWVDPLPLVSDTLLRYNTYQDVADNLPDVEVVSR